MIREYNIDRLRSLDPIRPGALVSLALRNETNTADLSTSGFGVVIAVLSENNVTVMWAIEPVDLYSRFALPLIKRVYPSLIAKTLIDIQPLSLPQGSIFYFDAQLGVTSGSFP